MNANEKWKELSPYQQADIRTRFNKYAYSAANNPPKESIYIPVIPLRSPDDLKPIPSNAPPPKDTIKRAEFRLRRNPLNPDDCWYDLFDIY